MTDAAAPPPGPRFNYVDIGERLHAYRLAAGLRSDDVAQRLGLSRAAVYKLERGEIVKIETLERLAVLFGVSLANLLGVEVEYHDSAIAYFERMRQLELRSTRIVAHFDPFSFLLTSDGYDATLRAMLTESAPPSRADAAWQRLVEHVLAILAERKAAFARTRPQLTTLVGLPQIDQFLHHGMVGRLGLPPGVQLERKLAARREVARLVELMRTAPAEWRIGVVADSLPGETFQMCEGSGDTYVAASPFRLGQLPNLRTGIATITTSPDAVAMHRNLARRLWAGAATGEAGAALLLERLDRV